jgi:hypothetical protein
MPLRRTNSTEPVAQLIQRPWMIHPIDLRGVQETLHVLLKSEDRWPTFCRVTPYALKNARARSAVRATSHEHARHPTL